MKRQPRLFILICLATTAFAVPAFAAETPAVVEVLLKNIERQTQIKPVFEKAESDSSGNVTITGLTLAPPATAEGSFNASVSEITLKNVSEGEAGLYTVGSAAFSGMKITSKGKDGTEFVAELPGGSADNWYLKDTGDTPSAADALRSSMTIAKKMTSGKITFSTQGQSVTSDGYEATWDGDPATGAGTFSSKLSNIVIPEGLIALIDRANTLKNLGYSGLTLEFSTNGTCTVKGDTMGIDMNVGIAGKDMAALKFAVKADQVPLAVYAELQKAQATGKEPDFTALMPQMQNVSLGGVSLRFEDASITQKMLPMIAVMSGMPDAAALVGNAGAMVQVSLMQLNVPEFTAQAVAAVNSFLQAPKSFTLAVKPAAPVTVQQLMTLDAGKDPAGAIKTLGLTVTAND